MNVLFLCNVYDNAYDHSDACDDYTKSVWIYLAETASTQADSGLHSCGPFKW